MNREEGTVGVILPLPGPDECAEYFWRYINQVPLGDVLALLRDQATQTAEQLGSIPPDRHSHRYAAGKWSVREVIGHVIDVERMFSFRAFCCARREPAALPSFEQDPYVANARYDRREMDEIIREYGAVRRASLALFESFDEDEWSRRGVASGVEFSARTIPFIVAGHEIHHWKVLRERYLAAS